MIVAKCPKCKWEQFTASTSTVRCFKCEQTYTLFPKNKPNRISLNAKPRN